jgi:hypothetical protein
LERLHVASIVIHYVLFLLLIDFSLLSLFDFLPYLLFKSQNLAFMHFNLFLYFMYAHCSLHALILLKYNCMCSLPFILGLGANNNQQSRSQHKNNNKFINRIGTNWLIALLVLLIGAWGCCYLMLHHVDSVMVMLFVRNYIDRWLQCWIWGCGSRLLLVISSSEAN